MDALLTQRAIAQAIVDRQGDYLMVVKDNQPTLRADNALHFVAPEGYAATMTRTYSSDRAHDRRARRTLQAGTALTGYLDWPGLAQVFRLERQVVDSHTGEVRLEVPHGLSSLATDRIATKEQLRRLR